MIQSSTDHESNFAKLVIEHQSRVRNYISSLGVAPSSIDDIAQEAFVVAFNNFDTYEPGTSFPAWVNTIARNLVWNDKRKTARRYKLLNEKAADLLIENDPGHDMLEQEDTDLQRQALRACMELLPDKYRDLLETRYQQELEPTQIAEKLGMDPGSLRKTLMRIRQALRECISKKLQEGGE